MVPPEPDTRANGAGIVGIKELDAGLFQGTADRFHVGGRAAARTQLAFHAPDGLKRDTASLG